MATDPNSPTVVTEVENAIEATAIVTALENEGIKAHTTGSFTSGFQAEAPGMVQVVVRQSDLETAREILARYQVEEADGME